MRHLLCPGSKSANVVSVLFPFFLPPNVHHFTLKTGHDHTCCHPAAFSAAKLADKRPDAGFLVKPRKRCIQFPARVDSSLNVSRMPATLYRVVFAQACARRHHVLLCLNSLSIILEQVQVPAVTFRFHLFLRDETQRCRVDAVA